MGSGSALGAVAVNCPRVCSMASMRVMSKFRENTPMGVPSSSRRKSVVDLSVFPSRVLVR